MPTALRQCEFRFYEELNDFLPPDKRRRPFTHFFDGTPSVKDRIEALGAPHTEVDLILVDGVSVSFAHRLHGGERVSVYPMFERLDIANLTHLRPEPLREPRFVLDVHLGKLARYLRLLGFDTLWRNDLGDAEIVQLSVSQHRIALTRDRGLLKRAQLTHGAFLRETEPRAQVREVLARFDLRRLISPCRRCPHCNDLLQRVAEQDLPSDIPPKVRAWQSEFWRCQACGQHYWKGTHYDRLASWLETLCGE